LAEIAGREDIIGMHPGGFVLDAVRVADGQAVAIKRTRGGTPEVAIGRFFFSEEVRSAPENHCAPVFDAFDDPRGDGFVFVVMPLFRRWENPSLKTIGEAIDMFSQLLEGLVFMHSQNVAHRDIASPNIMMDATAMYPEGFHPYSQRRAKDYPKTETARALTRTEAPPKYYFIDFGISSQFSSAESRSLVVGLPGRIRAPELSDSVPYDPFPVDIYGLGHFISTQLGRWRGLGEFQELAQSMTHASPDSRPSAEACLAEFLRIRGSLPRRHAVKRLFTRDQGILERLSMTIYDSVGLAGVTAFGFASTLVSRFRSSISRK